MKIKYKIEEPNKIGHKIISVLLAKQLTYLK